MFCSIETQTDKLGFMCGGIKYKDHQDKVWTVYFPSPKAALPVIKKDGGVDWVKWGKRKEEDARFFPNGGWARLDSIKLGKWEKYNPTPVLLSIHWFMEKDHEKKSHWFEVKPDEVIQGLLSTHDDDARVYVVTTDTPAEYSYIHDRRPRIIERNEEALHG